MSITRLIDDTAAWIASEICPKIKLKKPLETDDVRIDDAKYNEYYEIVHPVVYPVYVAMESPPDYESPYPYLCLQILEGQEAAIDRAGSVDMRIFIGVWNPGQHSKDLFDPVGVNDYAQRNDPTCFIRDSEGWRDIWNTIDVIVRALKSADGIGRAAVKTDVPIKYGPYKEQDAIVDMWPFWVGWVTFSLDYGIYRRVSERDDFLYG